MFDLLVPPESIVPTMPPRSSAAEGLEYFSFQCWETSGNQLVNKRALVHALCEVASRGGNLLLNVSPMADGALPAEQIARLDALAGWMSRHGDSIHDSQPGLEPWQFYGPSTRKGACASCHPRAETDGRTWALQNQPDQNGMTPSRHGVRDTMTMLGSKGDGSGNVQQSSTPADTGRTMDAPMPEMAAGPTDDLPF